MVALGYIERPDENREIAVRNTIRELRYNLGESYQDAGRHREAYGIFRGCSFPARRWGYRKRCRGL